MTSFKSLNVWGPTDSGPFSFFVKKFFSLELERTFLSRTILRISLLRIILGTRRSGLGTVLCLGVVLRPGPHAVPHLAPHLATREPLKDEATGQIW